MTQGTRETIGLSLAVVFMQVMAWWGFVVYSLGMKVWQYFDPTVVDNSLASAYPWWIPAVVSSLISWAVAKFLDARPPA